MRKTIIFSMMLGLLTAGLTSCGDKEYTDSQITYYIDLQLTGASEISVPLGSSYTDAGFTATVNGEDASSHVQMTSDVNTSELGPYSVTYTATNDDGYSSSVTRTVYVGTPNNASVATGSHRTNSSSGVVVNYSGYSILTLTDGNGQYWVEDLMGGYYEQRAGYGSAYSMPGFLQVNGDNSVSLIRGGGVAGWGDQYDSFDNGVYDPAANTITYDVTYASTLVFHVILQL